MSDDDKYHQKLAKMDRRIADLGAQVRVWLQFATQRMMLINVQIQQQISRAEIISEEDAGKPF